MHRGRGGAQRVFEEPFPAKDEVQENESCRLGRWRRNKSRQSKPRLSPGKMLQERKGDCLVKERAERSLDSTPLKRKVGVGWEENVQVCEAS